MVLKNFINYLINKYLKNYVQRLDYEKLKLGLHHGNIYLENLHLKPEALAYLNIPATVAVGFIEKLKVTIPWNSLSNHPTEVQIDGFYLLIVPKNEKSQDLSEHYAEKMKRVDVKVEHLRKAFSGDGSYDNKEMAFLERMRIQMMQNLNIKIRNFHVSYEMKSPHKLGHPFSFGLTLSYVEVSTANVAGKSHKRVKGNTILTYKIKEMHSLSIYWITQCQSRLEMPFDLVLNDLKSKIATNDFIPTSNEIKYILYPTNIRSESLITLRPKEHHYERSTLLFDIQLDEIQLHIDPQQVSDILDFLKLQNYTTIFDRCREYRDLLLQQLINKQSLNEEQMKRLRYLELKLDIFHLAFNRHRVEMDLIRLSTPKVEDVPLVDDHDEHSSNRIHPTTEPSTLNPFSKHFNRWDSISKIKHNLVNLSKKDHRKSSSSSSSSHHPNDKSMSFEDRPYIDAQILVQRAFLNLTTTRADMRYTRTDGKDEILACFRATNGQINVKKMCISSRVECSVEVESCRVFGIESDNEGKDQRPLILCPTPKSSGPILQLEFILFPDNRKSDYRLYLTIQPIQLFYHGPTFNQFVENFEANGPLVWQTQPQAENPIEDHLEQDLSLVKVFDLNISLKGCSIFIPECGVFQKNFSVIRLDFGDLLFRSILGDYDETNVCPLFEMNRKEQRFYTKYKLEIIDLRTIYLHGSSLSSRKQKQFFVLRPTPLIDIEFYQCIDFTHPSLMNWRMAMKIAMGEIQLSTQLLTKLQMHFKSIPLIYSNVASIVKRINHYFVLFPPNCTLMIDLAIYNCLIRLLAHCQRSIRTDFQIGLQKRKDDQDIWKEIVVQVKDILMLRHLSQGIQQSSRSFYRQEHLQLTYSNCSTRL